MKRVAWQEAARAGSKSRQSGPLLRFRSGSRANHLGLGYHVGAGIYVERGRARPRSGLVWEASQSSSGRHRYCSASLPRPHFKEGM